jgi:hypothetical protein
LCVALPAGEVAVVAPQLESAGVVRATVAVQQTTVGWYRYAFPLLNATVSQAAMRVRSRFYLPALANGDIAPRAACSVARGHRIQSCGRRAHAALRG